jgi:hypothetical protein
VQCGTLWVGDDAAGEFWVPRPGDGRVFDRVDWRHDAVVRRGLGLQRAHKGDQIAFLLGIELEF